jgi:20S proteasome alpha/beta subunit
MTIAAGFMCLDGVILSADTQETIPGYTKNKTEKIRDYSEGDFCIGITGSSDDSNLLKTIMQLLEDEVMGEWTARYMVYADKAKEIMERVFLQFVNTHVLIFPYNERPSLELLIAMREHHNHYLYKASGTTVREIKADADVVGSGQLLARSFIEKFYSPFMALDDMMIVAAYVMYEAKKYIDGCDGNTDMLVFSDPCKYFRPIPAAAITQLENKFREFDENMTGRLLTTISNPNMGEDVFTHSVQHFGKWMAEYRNDLRTGLFPETIRRLRRLEKDTVKPSKPEK